MKRQVEGKKLNPLTSLHQSRKASLSGHMLNAEDWVHLPLFNFPEVYTMNEMEVSERISEPLKILFYIIGALLALASAFWMFGMLIIASTRELLNELVPSFAMLTGSSLCLSAANPALRSWKGSCIAFPSLLVLLQFMMEPQTSTVYFSFMKIVILMLATAMVGPFIFWVKERVT